MLPNKINATNITWHKEAVTREDRRTLLGVKNKVVWFTGLSGSGKSTLAREVEKGLHQQGVLCYVLDGDNIRHGLNQDLGFSKEERDENIRRIAEVSKLLYEAGVVVLVSFISPYRKMRDFARNLIGEDFVEVFVDCPIEECQKRDVKGLYQKALAGEITGFTGVDDPYEKPENAQITVETSKLSISKAKDKIVSYLLSLNA